MPAHSHCGAHRRPRRAAERQAIVKRPPHILITTPESLYLMLTAERSRETLRTVQDGDRGRNPRDGAGQARQPPGALAGAGWTASPPSGRCAWGSRRRRSRWIRLPRFLTGLDDDRRNGARLPDSWTSATSASCSCGSVETTDVPLAAIPTHDLWDSIYDRLGELIEQHRTTLIFVNTRGARGSGSRTA